MENKVWIITKPSRGKYTPDCLRLEMREFPALRAGEVLLRTIYLSLDPSNRNSLTLLPNTSPVPLKVGDVMQGQTICVVEESASDGLAKGDLVAGMTGWATYSVVPAGPSQSLSPMGFVRHVKRDVPLEANMTIFSHIGYAAAAGIIGIGACKPTDTVAVSAAAGATGSLAAQIAKAIGARVIGIAGGPEKCRYLTEELGLDGAVDHRAGDMEGALKRLCPEGVSLFFDNVGGAVLDAVLMNLAIGARIAVCGQIALYNSADPSDGQGVRNITQLVFRSASMQGFFAGQPTERMPEYEAMLMRLLKEGKLRARAHIVKGLEQAAEALDLVLTGGNNGKLMVEVSAKP